MAGPPLSILRGAELLTVGLGAGVEPRLWTSFEKILNQLPYKFDFKFGNIDFVDNLVYSLDLP